MSITWWGPIPMQHVSLVLSPCPGQWAVPMSWGQVGFLLCLVPSASWGGLAHMISGAPTGLSICSMAASFQAHMYHCLG